MRIEASSINLAATRSYYQEQHSEESLEAWIGENRPQPGNSENTPARRPVGGPMDGDTVSLSARSLASQAAAHRARLPSPPAKVEEPETEKKPLLDAKLEALRMTIEMLTGKKIKVSNYTPHQPTAPEPNPAATADSEQQRVGWGMIYEYHASHYEEETTTFSAEGVITTSDGKEINFKLNLSMHREFYESTDISIRAGDGKLVDPLVVNFAGSAAELTDASFTFDLDADGSNDEMARLGAGSGFLALDHNQDGVINDGSELFGPTSGNGFAELAAYDSDNNGWLDENDPIFNELRLWIMGEGSSNYLATLASRGIGALLLDNADTEFSLNDSSNNTLGQIRDSSIFVRENGSVGTIQEVDLAV